MTPTTSARLTGKRCQCGECGEVFSTLANFDRHRKGSYRDRSRYCEHPEAVGLELKVSASGLYWAMPGRAA